MSAWRDSVAEFKAAGFSSRTAHGLIYGARIESLDELRREPWGSVEQRVGLAWQISTAPNCGKKAMAEAMAFREGKDPRFARAAGAISVNVPLSEGLAANLDVWIAKQPNPVSRAQAIRAFVAAGLYVMIDDK
jgi:hypothetical protein